MHVLASGDSSPGVRRFSLSKVASTSRCFMIMNKQDLFRLTKRAGGGGGGGICLPASAIIPSNRGNPDGRYEVL
jgi:hypothetical protein